MNTERLKELKFTSWCIDNATSIYVFISIIVVSGLLIYNSLPKELFPDVVVPTISIATIYPGATPEDIETLKGRLDGDIAGSPWDDFFANNGQTGIVIRITQINGERRFPARGFMVEISFFEEGR